MLRNTIRTQLLKTYPVWCKRSMNEMYTNDDDDIINNPPNDASLLNESIENNNNFKEIDNKWITQRKKKRNITVLLQN